MYCPVVEISLTFSFWNDEQVTQQWDHRVTNDIVLIQVRVCYERVYAENVVSKVDFWGPFSLNITPNSFPTLLPKMCQVLAKDCRTRFLFCKVNLVFFAFFETAFLSGDKFLVSLLDFMAWKVCHNFSHNKCLWFSKDLISQWSALVFLDDNLLMSNFKQQILQVIEKLHEIAYTENLKVAIKKTFSMLLTVKYFDR